MAENEKIVVRQTYTSTLKKLSVDQRFRNHLKNKSKARKANRKVKTTAGRLLRELERNLPTENNYQKNLDLLEKVLAQKRSNKDKIYFLH